MKTQKKYFAKIQISGNQFKTVIVYGYNEKEAINWASKMGMVIKVECIGEAVEEFDDEL
jgi:hypothetical protein